MKVLKSFWLWVLVIIVALVAFFFMPPTQSAKNPASENTQDNPQESAQSSENTTSSEDSSETPTPEPSQDAVESISSTHHSNSRVCNIHKTVPAIEASAQHLDQNVLELGLTAYNCAIEAGMDKQEVLTLIDYTMPSTDKRLWVFDLHRNRILFNTWVAHGSGTGGVKATKFSNQPESHKSSIGLFRTGSVYTGKHGHSLTLYGLEPGFNDKAASRHVVIHSAAYVGKNRASSSAGMGRSWGCPALSPKEAQPIIQAVKEGTLLFSYYPDPKWLKESKYLNCIKGK